MIFQPTNVIPSATGNLGDGTVDVSNGLNISWMVNGNSPLTAFEIKIYQNTASSNVMYSTGKLADNCPFYGVSFNGEQQYFSYKIPASELLASGIVNGSEYKLVITQYWGNNSDEVTVQTSASAFITRSAPRLSIVPITSPMASKEYTFYGNYIQDQGDSLNWVRWQIAFANDLNNPFYDSQNIYGTTELKTTYDGFLTGNTYAVKLMVQTENGVNSDTGWQTFEVRYATSAALGVVSAKCIGGNHSGIEVSWPLLSFTPGTASGYYKISGTKQMLLDYGANVVWNTQNGKQLSFNAPFSVIFKGRVRDSNAELFSINTDNGRLVLRYDKENQKISLFCDGKELMSTDNVLVGATVSAVITPSTAYFRASTENGGLYPSETLKPNNALYPMSNLSTNVITNGDSIMYSQGNINSVSMSGGLVADFLQILSNTPTEQIINSIILNEDYTPAFDGQTYFLSDFTDGLNAGNVKGVGGTLTGLTVYRQDGDNTTLKKIATIKDNVSRIYDYSVKSQQGPYTYYVFPQSQTTYISAPLVSNKISPCFWNWTILSCTEREDGTYEVNSEYTFGKNLSSGAISNNNVPAVFNNFTRFPTVQIVPQNYQSGTLTSLIGFVDKNAKYSDTIALRNAIWNLSTTTDALFLKNRKGDFFEIKTSAAVTMETMDNSREQAQTVAIPWVQISESEGVSVTVIPKDNIFLI